MNSKVSRRHFMKAAALGVVLPATLPLNSSSNRDPTLLPAPFRPEQPNVFAFGVVEELSTEEFSLRVGPEISKVFLPSSIPIWRMGFVKSSAIRLGDTAAVAGFATPAGDLEARRMWINIPREMLGTRW